jgi:hypothetical protein
MKINTTCILSSTFQNDFISGFKQTLKLKIDGILTDDRNFQNTENTKGRISLGG